MMQGAAWHKFVSGCSMRRRVADSGPNWHGGKEEAG